LNKEEDKENKLNKKAEHNTIYSQNPKCPYCTDKVDKEIIEALKHETIRSGKDLVFILCQQCKDRFYLVITTGGNYVTWGMQE
jgi:hypothetical protein